MDPAKTLATLIALLLRADERHATLREALRFGHARPTFDEVRACLDREHGDLEVDDNRLRQLITALCSPSRRARAPRRSRYEGQLELPLDVAA